MPLEPFNGAQLYSKIRVEIVSNDIEARYREFASLGNPLDGKRGHACLGVGPIFGDNESFYARVVF